MNRATVLLLSVLLFPAACGRLERVDPRDDASDPQPDAGRPTVTDAGSLWTMEVHAETFWAATAAAGDTVAHDPAEPPADDRLRASAHFRADAAEGGASANASLGITLEDRAIRFDGRAAQVSPGTAAPSGASAGVTGLRVCLEALGAKRFRRTFECSGTLAADAGGGAAISAASDTTLHCATGKYPEGEQAWSFPGMVTALDAAPEGQTCFEATTIRFGAGGGTEGAGTASAEGSITARFEPVY